MLLSLLAAHPAAIHRQNSSGDVVARGGGQINSGACEILWLAPASGWDSLENLAVPDGIGLQSFSVRGRKVAGRDCVHLDVVSRPFIRESLRELCDSALRRGVSRNTNAALKAQKGSDVDDLSA